MYVASWCSMCFCVILCVSFCTGHFVMVPLNLTYLHCLQHSFLEHLFNLFCIVSGYWSAEWSLHNIRFHHWEFWCIQGECMISSLRTLMYTRWVYDAIIVNFDVYKVSAWFHHWELWCIQGECMMPSLWTLMFTRWVHDFIIENFDVYKVSVWCHHCELWCLQGECMIPSLRTLMYTRWVHDSIIVNFDVYKVSVWFHHWELRCWFTCLNFDFIDEW